VLESLHDDMEDDTAGTDNEFNNPFLDYNPNLFEMGTTTTNKIDGKVRSFLVICLGLMSEIQL
jgi:hypothetical protein